MNAIEISHRHLKNLLDGCWKQRSIPDLLLQVCLVTGNKIKRGFFSKLVCKVSEPSHKLLDRPSKTLAPQLSLVGEILPDSQVLPKRLDFNRIAKHYQQHGAEGSFITQNVRILLPNGEMSKRVYIMPKYSMDRVSQSQADMQAALRLATAQTATDVERSCANLATGTYDFKRHMHLRQNYVTVFLTSDGSVLDMHKDFMKGGGFSEHSIFFDRLVHFRGDFLDSFCQGPRNNRPQIGKEEKEWQEV